MSTPVDQERLGGCGRRVLVGSFLNRAAAATVLKELATGGYPAFIALE